MDYTEVDFKIEPKYIAADIIIAELAELGYDTFEDTETGFKAYIETTKFVPNAISEIDFIKENKTFQISWEAINIPAQNWNEVWEKSFEPVRVGNECIIRAPFHEKPAEIKYDIVIEPKMSFGTGHHQTTFLMAQNMLLTEIKGKSVLDVGCGTGILAILASMEGATEVVGVDIDNWAFENSIENIHKNNVENVQVILGTIDVVKHEPFDIILANINRNVILNDFHKYDQLLAKGGEIFFSGFLDVDKDLIIKEAGKYNLKPNKFSVDNHWTLLSFIK